MKRCVIIGSAEIKNYEKAKLLLTKDDFYIFCDGGLVHRECLGITPNLIVGDFDSYEKPDLPIETIALPCEKDDTDTFFAAKEAVKRGFDNFLLLGVVGGRLDHTIGNLSILLMLNSLGKRAELADDYSIMEIVSDNIAYVDNTFSYFSILNITGRAEGISIKNAKYPLCDASISCEWQYGISNEVLPGKTTEISVKKGNLLLIKVY